MSERINMENKDFYSERVTRERAEIERRNGKRTENPDKNVMRIPLEMIAMMAPMADPNGSYTGVPINPFEKPVQDADDL